MSGAKYLAASVVLILMAAPLMAYAQTSAPDNVIQNTAALAVGKKFCGFTPNLQFEALALKAYGLTTTDLLPSGRFGNLMAQYYAQANALMDSPSDIADFCDTIRSTLPNMIK